MVLGDEPLQLADNLDDSMQRGYRLIYDRGSGLRWEEARAAGLAE